MSHSTLELSLEEHSPRSAWSWGGLLQQDAGIWVRTVPFHESGPGRGNGWQQELRVRCGEDPSSQPACHRRPSVASAHPKLAFSPFPKHPLSILCSHIPASALTAPSTWRTLSLCVRSVSPYRCSSLDAASPIKPSQLPPTTPALSVCSLSPYPASTASPQNCSSSAQHGEDNPAEKSPFKKATAAEVAVLFTSKEGDSVGEGRLGDS